MINYREFSAPEVTAMLGSGGTVRYHTHQADVLKPQDVAQHSYNVVWLVFALTSGQASLALIMGALTHDAGERWAGDLPSPTKRFLNIRQSFGRYEDEQLKLHTGYEHAPLTPSEERILKIADALEGARYCHHEETLGNPSLRGILQNFRDYTLEELKSPYPHDLNAGLAHALLNLYTEGLRRDSE